MRPNPRRILGRLAAAGLSAVSLAGCVGVAYPPPPPPVQVVGYAQPRRFSIPSDVLFAFDSASLRPEAASALQQTLNTIRQAIPNPHVRVEGNTDSIGSDGYNQRLSLQRAQAVAQWLETAGGIPPAVVSTVGNGKTRPIAPNTLPDGRDNPNGRALNRRVDLVATSG